MGLWKRTTAPRTASQLSPEEEGNICIAFLLIFLFLLQDYFTFAFRRRKQSSGYTSLYSLQKHDLWLSRVRTDFFSGTQKRGWGPFSLKDPEADSPERTPGREPTLGGGGRGGETLLTEPVQLCKHSPLQRCSGKIKDGSQRTKAVEVHPLGCVLSHDESPLCSPLQCVKCFLDASQLQAWVSEGDRYALLNKLPTAREKNGTFRPFFAPLHTLCLWLFQLYDKQKASRSL